MPDLYPQEVQQILEETPRNGALGLQEQSLLVQHLADKLLQDIQLSQNMAQVTSKFGHDRLCIVLSAI